MLPLTAVSHRFHSLILRILHHRLLVAAALKDHKLILECYHPSSKYSEPYLGCEYVGTDGLSDSTEGQGSFYHDVGNTGQLGKLSGLYSYFRPFRMDVEDKRPRRHPAGDVPGHPGTSTSFPSRASDDGPKHEDLVSHNVTLEAHELFSQLCGCVNLVKVGPRRGLFLSCVSVGEGVIRIWREWLQEMSRHALSSSQGGIVEPSRKPRSNGSAQDGIEADSGEERTLWIDKGNVGLKVVVTERKWRRDQPILIGPDEDVAVSYAIGFEG